MCIESTGDRGLLKNYISQSQCDISDNCLNASSSIPLLPKYTVTSYCGLDILPHSLISAKPYVLLWPMECHPIWHKQHLEKYLYDQACTLALLSLPWEKKTMLDLASWSQEEDERQMQQSQVNPTKPSLGQPTSPKVRKPSHDLQNCQPFSPSISQHPLSSYRCGRKTLFVILCLFVI